MTLPSEPSVSKGWRGFVEAQFGETDLRSATAAIVSITAVGMGLGLTGPLLSLLMEARGFSSSFIGTNTAVAGVAAIIAVPFVTAFSRMVGVVNALVANILMAAVCLIAFYYTDPMPSWFVLRFLFSINLSMAFVLSEFWINSSATDKNRGLLLGIYGTVLSIGFSAGPAVIAVTGIEGIMPFLSGAIIIALAVIPPLWARHGQPIMESSAKTPSIIPFLFIVPLATAAGFVFGAVEQAEMALLAVFGVKTGYSQSTAALLLVVLGLGHVFFQIPLGMWSDRISDRRIILALCCVFGLVSSLLFPVAAAYPLALFALVFFHGGVIGGLYTVGLAHLGSRLKGTDLAQANAAFVLCYGIGMLVGPQFVGMTMDRFEPDGYGWGLGVFFFAYLVLYGYRRGMR